jgi:YD repeat-containing protein
MAMLMNSFRVRSRFGCRPVTAVCAAACVAACGGGTGGFDPSAQSPVLIGHFSDGSVDGLGYSTRTLSGVTDSGGAFRYRQGETVAFSIGDAVIGQVPGAAEIDALDLVAGAPVFVTRTTMLNAFGELDSGTRDAELIAFNRFLNIIGLLQTIDVDSNPDNGISIDQNLAAMFSGIQLNLESSFETFRSAQPLKGILHQASAQGLLRTAQFRKVGRTLDHFYSFQGIPYSAARPVRVTTDIDADTDPGIDLTLTIVYDADGNEAGSSQIAGGSPFMQIDFSYDEFGNRLTDVRDLDVDGNVERALAYSYDANGNLILVTEDAGGDGVFEQINSYTYDDRGNRASHSEDRDADGSIDFITTYSYDHAGRVIVAMSDSDADGVAETDFLSTYNDNGQLTSYAVDFGPDGIPDNLDTYTYDTDGNLTSFIHDFGADEILEHIRTYEYDAAGNETAVLYDNNADGLPDSIVTKTYDANNNQTSEVNDNNGDGTIDHRATWAYDANGNPTSFMADSGADGTIDMITTYAHDSAGNRTSISIDNNADGNADSVTSTTYDANGNVTSESVDGNGDGIPEQIKVNEFEPGSWWTALRI